MIIMLGICIAGILLVFILLIYRLIRILIDRCNNQEYTYIGITGRIPINNDNDQV